FGKRLARCTAQTRRGTRHDGATGGWLIGTPTARAGLGEVRDGASWRGVRRPPALRDESAQQQQRQQLGSQGCSPRRHIRIAWKGKSESRSAVEPVHSTV